MPSPQLLEALANDLFLLKEHLTSLPPGISGKTYFSSLITSLFPQLLTPWVKEFITKTMEKVLSSDTQVDFDCEGFKASLLSQITACEIFLCELESAPDKRTPYAEADETVKIVSSLEAWLQNNSTFLETCVPARKIDFMKYYAHVNMPVMQAAQHASVLLPRLKKYAPLTTEHILHDFCSFLELYSPDMSGYEKCTYLMVDMLSVRSAETVNKFVQAIKQAVDRILADTILNIFFEALALDDSWFLKNLESLLGRFTSLDSGIQAEIRRIFSPLNASRALAFQILKEEFSPLYLALYVEYEMKMDWTKFADITCRAGFLEKAHEFSSEAKKIVYEGMLPESEPLMTRSVISFMEIFKFKWNQLLRHLVAKQSELQFPKGTKNKIKSLFFQSAIKGYVYEVKKTPVLLYRSLPSASSHKPELSNWPLLISYKKSVYQKLKMQGEMDDGVEYRALLDRLYGRGNYQSTTYTRVEIFLVFTLLENFGLTYSPARSDKAHLLELMHHVFLNLDLRGFVGAYHLNKANMLARTLEENSQEKKRQYMERETELARSGLSDEHRRRDYGLLCLESDRKTYITNAIILKTWGQHLYKIYRDVSPGERIEQIGPAELPMELLALAHFCCVQAQDEFIFHYFCDLFDRALDRYRDQPNWIDFICCDLQTVAQSTDKYSGKNFFYLFVMSCLLRHEEARLTCVIEKLGEKRSVVFASIAPQSFGDYNTLHEHLTQLLERKRAGDQDPKLVAPEVYEGILSLLEKPQNQKSPEQPASMAPLPPGTASSLSMYSSVVAEKEEPVRLPPDPAPSGSTPYFGPP